MIRWLLGPWRATQRAIDLQILWPTCKRIAMERHPTEALDYAKAAFAVHAFNDPAWLTLGEDAIVAFIDELQ